jgi:hypothetical protein
MQCIESLPRITIAQRTISRSQTRSYAFVEFRSQRDAEDAYYDMSVVVLLRILGAVD